MRNIEVQIEANKIYFNQTKFEIIKENVRNVNDNLVDFNSFFCINYGNYSFMINQLFNLDIYLNKVDEFLYSRIEEIEKIIKTQIKDFSYDKSYKKRIIS